MLLNSNLINQTFGTKNRGYYSILVQGDGQLILEDGEICAINNRFKDITVENGGYLELNNTTVIDYDIKIKAGGTLHVKNSLVVDGGNSIEIEDGAYICVEVGSAITLTNWNDVILLKPGFINGVNPSLGLSPFCNVKLAVMPTTGNGKIISIFPNDLYIQNRIFSTNEYIVGENIYIGENVTSSLPQGPVTILNGVTVYFHALQEVTESSGFETQTSGAFEIK